jgi:chromate transport protein ChrA
MENIGIVSIWSILRPFVIFYGSLVQFSRFGTNINLANLVPGPIVSNVFKFFFRGNNLEKICSTILLTKRNTC